MLQCRSKKGKVLFLFIALMMGLFLLAGCSGDDGATGPQGEQGIQGEQGDPGEPGPAGADGVDASAMAEAESCAICHNGSEQPDGMSHQAVYNDYTDTSRFDLVITDVTTVVPDSTMTFTITKDGVAYEGADTAGDLDQARFYAAAYDSATREVTEAFSYSTITATGTPGEYTVSTAAATFAPEATNAYAYAYITDDKLDIATGGHVSLYNDVDNAGLDYGDVGTYMSAANVAGCEKCHGTPYMKHGYRAPEADTLPDFMSCKVCHVDTTDGGHISWQVLYDDPAREADVELNGLDYTADEEAKYAYKRSIMNDVHMAHNMEFAYPQSMRNCATCHDGQLDTVLTTENFVLETCKSCHAVDNLAERVPHAIPDPAVQQCNVCHVDAGGGIAPAFASIHNGYDPEIYTADGTMYSDAFNVTIDSASLSAENVLTFTFTAHEAIDLDGLSVTDVAPSVLLGLYGYSTKDFIVSSHGRTIDGSERDLEYTVGDTHPRFETVAAADGSWTVAADLSAWATQIDDGIIKRAEIAVRPRLEVDVTDDDVDNPITVAVDAPSRTFNVADGAFEDFFDPIVDVSKCNACHDALGTTFHSADRGGNVVVCRICHVGLSGGSHLEMQSRSIDSYVHAVHSFQAFDYDEIDFTDPVQKMEYMHHTESTFPNFTILNCEACHTSDVAIVYDVPNQSMSMPGKLSGSFMNDTMERSIGDVPAYVTGPASRACGSCHRTHMINEDMAGDLATFNAHTDNFGTLIEDGDGVLDDAIDTIMSMFN